VRFEGEEFEGANLTSTVALQLERDDTGRWCVFESGLRSARLRLLQGVPPCPSIAPFERVRTGHRLRLVHPRPLIIAPPAEEFVVAQAIGSLLDGLAWLHVHGVAHGAVGPTSLVEGPTGGRLSLAGACSNSGAATPADDVFAASALAFTLLFGEPPGGDAPHDPRLSTCTSPAVAEAIREGLDPIAARRPTALALATLVRGEQWLPEPEVVARPPLLGRMRATLSSAAHSFDRRWAGVAGGAVAMVLFVGGLSAARSDDTTRVAAIDPITEFLPPDERPRDVTLRPSTTVATAPPTTAAPSTTAAPPTTEPEVAVLSASEQAPAPTAAAPPPPTTRAAPPPTQPPPPPPPPTTAAPAPTTTRPVATTRVTTTTRPKTTTTTRANPNKGKGSKGKGSDDDDVERDSLLGTLIGILLDG
jgi:hypothetical protein